jgi:exonuclease SbcD
MRILHTSDWHLGRSLHGQSLLEGQAAFVDFLVDVVRDQQIDVVLVAGDLYDRAIPPVEAVELFSDALSRIAAVGTPVVLTSGNHDSAARLGFGHELIAAAGVHLRTDPALVARPVELADAHGPVAIYPIPYLEPELTWSTLGAPAARHEAVLAAAMAAVRDDAARRRGARIVVTAHAFVAGVGEARESDSERDISVGGSALAAASIFDGAHYVALGHLHRAQQPMSGRVAYSGSPLAYSFSEAGQTKSVTVVDLAADGATTLEQIPCPVTRPLARLSGPLDELLHDRRYAAYEHHWLSVTLTDDELPREPIERLRARFPGVLQLTVAAHRARAGGSYVQRLEGLDDLALVGRFVEDMWNRPARDDELDLIRAGFEAQRIREVSR